MDLSEKRIPAPDEPVLTLQDDVPPAIGPETTHVVVHETTAGTVVEEQVAEEEEGPSFTGFWDKTRWSVSYAYNKLAVNHLSFYKKWTWFNRIDKVLILGALPDKAVIQLLRDTVAGVINMCAEHPGEGKNIRSVGISYLRLKTPDFTVPEYDALVTGVKWIEKIADGSPGSDNRPPRVYVHCKAGRGRSAAVVICWLVYRYQLTPLEAQNIMFSKRPQVDKTLHLHPRVVQFYQCALETNGATRQEWDDS
ncbi:protein-tyrosine phosphatase-like protein [Fimicolochytrium jonesii]|uniref:protein-tyrosine phosphatase-like protein n=1 Tax=Fimicolochytrium jonesii TaxID=1396493 RepID=UPI0022FEA8B3|nr:protein-tyrosine phosphatase-like protein [Fimicolochytrium jonesii]KAI8819630.1 protein-tyrosine phosphatase-like protein [Fimicolochytrium jonesii]